MYSYIVVEDKEGLFVLVDGVFECKHLNNDMDICLDCGELL